MWLFLLSTENEFNGAAKAIPGRGLLIELLAANSGEGIGPGAAAEFTGLPFRGDPVLVFEAMEGSRR